MFTENNRSGRPTVQYCFSAITFCRTWVYIYRACPMGLLDGRMEPSKPDKNPHFYQLLVVDRRGSACEEIAARAAGTNPHRAIRPGSAGHGGRRGTRPSS
jgi:hypothetical protein